MNARHEQFCLEYLVDLNATQAAIRAGFSRKSADSKASQLMSRPDVAARIIELRAQRSQRTEITADRVVNELARVAFGDVRKVLKWRQGGVEIIDSDSLSDDEAALVAGAEEKVSDNGTTVKLALHDKVKALELLGRHLGMFKDKVEQSGSLQLVVTTNVTGGES